MTKKEAYKLLGKKREAYKHEQAYPEFFNVGSASWVVPPSFAGEHEEDQGGSSVYDALRAEKMGKLLLGVFNSSYQTSLARIQ